MVNNTCLNDYSCSICFVIIKKQDMKLLDCNHNFHKACLTKWVKIQLRHYYSCPMCRQEYKISEYSEKSSVQTKNPIEIVRTMEFPSNYELIRITKNSIEILHTTEFPSNWRVNQIGQL